MDVTKARQDLGEHEVRSGIARKPGVVEEKIAVREYLSLTLDFDHDIIDGAPAVRFA